MRGWTLWRAEPILSLLRTFLPLRWCSYSTLGTVGVRGYTVCSYKKVVARAAFLQCLRYNANDTTIAILSKGGGRCHRCTFDSASPPSFPPVRRPRGSVTSTCVHPAIIPRSSQAAQGASTLSFMSTRRVDTRPPPPPTTGYRDTDPRRVFVLPSPINLHER